MADSLISEHNIYKRRLDLEGKPLADPVKHEVGESQANDTTVAKVDFLFNKAYLLKLSFILIPAFIIVCLRL